jgi:hypothetical protein
MPEDSLNASNPENEKHHWFPFLRFKKECEAAGKEVSYKYIFLHANHKQTSQKKILRFFF